MTMRSKIATSTFVAAALSVGLATAAEAHGPGNMGIRFHNPPQHIVAGPRLPPRPQYAAVVGHLTAKPAFFKPPPGGDCKLPDCRVHHGTGGAAGGSVSGGDPGSGQGGSGGGDGGGGGGGHLCLSDRDCGPLHQD
jgi:hypothetical protein